MKENTKRYIKRVVIVSLLFVLALQLLMQLYIALQFGVWEGFARVALTDALILIVVMILYYAGIWLVRKVREQ